MDDATNPAFNPFDPETKERFEAVPIVDFAQLALDMEAKARRKLVSAEDDYPLLWKVSRRSVGGDEPDPADGEDDGERE